jgi:MerR family transcriptional regulator/heat shock protein HspR
VRPFDVDPTQGVYGISVAADLVGMDPQSLRLYERRGLVEPARTDGGTRRYSSDNLARLERIGELLAAGLNLAGIAMVLQLETDNARLRAQLGLADDAAAVPSLRTHKPARRRTTN